MSAFHHVGGPSTTATGTSSNNLTATTSNQFKFLSTDSKVLCMKKILLQNDVDSGAKLYAKFNDTPASATDYDVCLSPGDIFAQGESLLVSSVSLFCNSDMTFGEDFNLVGWQ